MRSSEAAYRSPSVSRSRASASGGLKLRERGVYFLVGGLGGLGLSLAEHSLDQRLAR